MQHIVVIGHTDVGRRACAALQSRDVHTTHLDAPTDTEITAALAAGIDGVVVLLHDDIRALRYCLVVAHAQRGIRIFVAIFDRTARAQIESVIPNCVVLSPSAIAVPTIVAEAIAPEHASVRRSTSSSIEEWVSIDEPVDGRAHITAFETPGRIRARGWWGRLRGPRRPYGAGSAVLLGGALGLILVIIIDTLVGLRHESLLRALYDAARTTATISSPDLPNEPAYLIWGFVAALLVMGFTAAFAAGIVQHLLSGRRVSLIGRRVVPRAGHVVVVGMGQVGLRLAQEFRALGIAVVGIERDHQAPSLVIARDLSIPVLVGDAASRRMLRRAGLSRAIAVVAAGSEERDNIAVAISAIAVAPNVPVVLRAGADDAIDETRSLFHIGAVVDVNGLTAAFVVQAMLGEIPYAVILEGESLLNLDDAGMTMSSSPGSPMRCTC